MSAKCWRLVVLGAMCAAADLYAALAVNEARGIRVPMFDAGRIDPVAELRVSSLKTEHRRFGAFSVKLLPLVVAQGVVLEIEQPAWTAGALARFGQRLCALGGGSQFEAYDFELNISGEPRSRLQARKAWPAARKNASVLALSGVTLGNAEQRLSLPQAARLDCRTGRVLWHSSREAISFDLLRGSFTTNLFHFTSNSSKP